MRGIFLTLFLVLCSLHTIQGSFNLEKYHHYFHKRERVDQCEQETPNCEQCLAKSGCSWCGADYDGNFECMMKQRCSRRERQNNCNLEPLESDPRETFPVEKSPALLLDLPVINNLVLRDVNSCSLRKNCSHCTSSQDCSWCEKTTSCLHFYNSSTTAKTCASDLWYRDQCLYSSKVKPCPQRTGGCKECTSDGVCFWCKSTGNCSYYPHDAYVPNDCPSDSWYYKSCSHMKLIVVLAPILCILFIPVLIFIVLGIVLWCMRRMGYQGLDDPEEAAEEPESPPKEKKPFMMNHKPAPSRVEELRKKYNLGGKP